VNLGKVRSRRPLVFKEGKTSLKLSLKEI